MKTRSTFAWLVAVFAFAGTGVSAIERTPRPPGAGILYYAKANSATNTSVIANTNIVGAFFQVIWSEVEKQDGVCDWSAVDSWIQPWLAAGKKVAIRVMWSTSGYWPQPYYKTPTPQWVWQKGARFAFHAPSGTEIPLIWDAIYQQYAWRFLEQFAARYEANPNLLFVDLTPGAETNPYRFGTINEVDPGFKDIFLATPDSAGRTYNEDLWLNTVYEWVLASDGIFKQVPLLVTLNTGGFTTNRLRTIGQFCVDHGFYVGQNGLKGSSYTNPATSPFYGWATNTTLFFEMHAATGGSTGTLLEVMQAAERIRCRYLNVYPEDVERGTPGDSDFDPAYATALQYGAEVLARNAPLILSGMRTGGDFRLDWNGVPGEFFRVEHRAGWHTNQPWLPLATNLPAAGLNTNTTFIHSNALQQPSGFYRVSK